MLRLLLLALMIASSVPDLPAKTRDRDWQEGIVTFRQTLRTGPAQHYRYLYRVRGPGGRYLVMLDQPLSALPNSPVTFSVSGRHLLIRDEDGSEHKAAIVRRAWPDRRR
jgi:hypothetical protein